MSESTDSTNLVRIIANVCSCVGFAAWQNSVPFLKTLSVVNDSTESFENLTLKMDSDSGCLRAKEWALERVLPGDEIVINDRMVELNSEYLGGLNESEKSTIKFSLRNRESNLEESVDQKLNIAEHLAEVRVLARNEWGGLDAGGELLAAFVLPNDPAIAKILKAAAKILERHGHSTALDGYQSGDPKRAYLLVASIWNAICRLGLTYANPPKSFEMAGQKTRLPERILADGLATCLDSSLLFAAAIEAVGLNPVIIMTEGHCFAGAWLVEKTLNQIIESDVSEIRKALSGYELVTFETTYVTQSPRGRFPDAVRTAKSATQESRENGFVAAIDIQRARMAQIRPLASHSISEKSDVTTERDGEFLPLDEAPEFTQLPVETSQEKPTTPSGRIDRWQRKLLDLTMRNRLLNFRSTLQTVPILCTNIARLEDLLAQNKRLKLISLPDQNPIGERDPELHRQKTDSDLNAEFAAQALARNEVCCVLATDQMDKRLVNLYRASRNDMAEGGTNTLFLAVGFLRWRQKAGEKKTYRAPLVLVPIKLTRRSSQSPFHLQMHEDDTRFNSTLIQMLKQDFGKDITRFESDMPRDESGVNVPLILQQVRQHVRDIAGTEVIDECALGRFSFAKYLLWKDLVDRTSQLKKNRVVRHLLEGQSQPFDSGPTPIPSPTGIEKRFHPQEIYHPLDADSSQLSAVMAASDGKDFVLIGPPGTGKSQTIANMIAQCLATGKTVLFVAEKTAALDVVHRRLVQHGLGDCCVELHSNKAERKKFLAQLEANWNNNRRVQGNDWVSISDQIKIRRDQLNTYVETINQLQPNGWTAFDAFWESANGSDCPDVHFDWNESERHDQETYKRLESVAVGLGDSYQSIANEVAFPMVSATDWSVKWENELLSEANELGSAATKLQDKTCEFSRTVGLPNSSDGSIADLDNLKQLAFAIEACGGEDVRVLFHKQFSKFPQALDQLESSILEHRRAYENLSGIYGANLTTLPLEDFDLQWRTASASIWPFSWFAKRKVKRLLSTYSDDGDANPATDLKAIRTIREQASEIENNPLNKQSRYWNSVETDLDRMRQQIAKARQLRKAIKLVGDSRNVTRQISTALLPFISGKAESQSIVQLSQQFAESLAAFNSAVKVFAKLAGQVPVNKRDDAVCAIAREKADFVRENRVQLKRWTSWCMARTKAQSLGMTQLVSLLESKAIDPAELNRQFRVTYARWFIPILVDKTPVLRTFEKYKHEKVIQDFCRLDTIARGLAAGKAREAIAHGLPRPSGVAKKSELGVLRHQMQLKRPSKSIRDVVTRMPDSFRKLAPCLLMSPLSIAHYLPANQPPFDVVIFDEASQITTWDAIGAIARGKQTIIVGDPKQLPPTNFFGKNDDDEFDDDTSEIEKDLESILDEAKASGLPELNLHWHYRSRHESLIAFSNYQYYRNELITFPAADDIEKGVSLTQVAGAYYDLGKSRTNRTEAQAIVNEAIRRMKLNLSLPKGKRRTFGVITFNIQQQSLIQDLFDQSLKTHPECEWYFSDARIEPTVVKNLENVQGDERDVMFFSVTFGPTESNPRVGLNFGALNRDGGHRRLNVAVTRARQQMLIYSSFSPDQLDAASSKSRGLNDLKKFLEFASANGELALGGQTQDSVGGFDSPFEEAVSEALELRGWIVIPQIGVSGFRIDLGVKHPDKPGTYLAGVECDGATYHRSATARDRDKTRQLVLEGLGWNVLRIWSPDWWHDPNGVAVKLDQQLQELLEQDRSDQEPTSEAEHDDLDAVTSSEVARECLTTPGGTVLSVGDQMESVPIDVELEPPVSNKEPKSGEGAAENPAGIQSDSFSHDSPTPISMYEVVALPDYSENSGRFYDDEYRETLREIATKVVAVQGPIREDVLALQIARAHGFGRMGARIKDQILLSLKGWPVTVESTGRFLWPWDAPVEPVIPFRIDSNTSSQRSVDQVSVAELRGLVRANSDALIQTDPALMLARRININRLSESARQRLTEAINLEIPNGD